MQLLIVGRSVSCQLFLGFRVWIALLMLFSLFIGRFWWYGGTTSWAGTIRVCLLLSLLFAVFDYRCTARLFSESVGKWWLVALVSLLILSSIFLGDGKSARRVVLLMGLFVSIALLVQHAGHAVRYLLGIMVVISAGISIFSICNLWSSGYLNFEYRTGAISGSGVSGVADFENSVLASLQLSFSCVVAFWLFLEVRGLSKFLWVLCFAVIGAYIFLTYGRTGWLCVAVASIVLIVLLPSSRTKRLLISGGAMLGVASAFFLKERIAYEIFVRNVSSRDEIWGMVLGLMPGRWLIGWGGDESVQDLLGVQLLGGSPYLISHPHSVYLEILFNYGLVGLVIFLAVLTAAFSGLWRGRHESLYRLWLAVLAGAAIGMVFDFSTPVSTPNLLWLWLWVPLAWSFAAPPRANGDLITNG